MLSGWWHQAITFGTGGPVAVSLIYNRTVAGAAAEPEAAVVELSDLAPRSAPQTDPSLRAETSGKAIASLVLGILSLTSCGPLGIIAIVVGNTALADIRASRGRLTGDGMAKAGVITGWIGVVLFVLGLVVGLAFMGGAIILG